MKATFALSRFQLDALRYAAAGYTAKATGEALGKSAENVLRARQVARRKLGAPNIEAAVRKAHREGYPVMQLPADAPADPGAWVREWQRGHEFVDHVGGVSWCEAPLPKEVHRCIPQTRGVVRVSGLPLMPFVRCPCGACHIDGVWEERNSRATRPSCEAVARDV